MAMSATAAMVMPVAAAIVVAAAAAVAAAPATALAAQHVEHALDFVLRGIAVLSDFAHEVQGFPGQRVDDSYDVSVQPVNLQRAFVALCGEEARHEA